MGIIGPLVDGAKRSLLAAGVAENNITVHTVPGSYELPFAVQKYAHCHQASPFSGILLVSSETGADYVRCQVVCGFAD